MRALIAVKLVSCELEVSTIEEEFEAHGSGLLDLYI